MKGTQIPVNVRMEVYERDSIDGHPCCIYCGNPHGIQIAHYISRARGGKGVPENLACLCYQCHAILDNGADSKKRREIHDYMKHYLEAQYPGWNEDELIVRRK